MIKIPARLRPLACHGVEFASRSGDQLRGSCPFCLDGRHLYANANTGQWDCKKCGEQGNVVTFLEKIAKLYLRETTADDYRRLSKDRGLPPKVFKRHEVAWDGTQWLIPVRSPTGRVHDIRRWNPTTRKMMATAGCQTQLFGGNRLAKANARLRIWVCEGESDAMALEYLLRDAERKDIVVGVPGANTFKKSWIGLFSNRDVRLCYDRDDAGRKGAEKVATLLCAVAKQVRVIKWGSRKPKGYDIRDFVVDEHKRKRRAQASLKTLEAILVTPPQKSPKDAPDERKPTDPHLLAHRLREQYYCHDGLSTLRFHNGEWFSWKDRHYRHVSKVEMQARINRQLRTTMDSLGFPQRQVLPALVTSVLQALAGICLVASTVQSPAWLSENPKPAHGDLLQMANGLLDLDGAVDEQDDVLHEPTPEWFSTTHWTYEYHPTANCPRWKKFLREVLPGAEERSLLQEFIGLCLTFDMSYQKFLLLVGEGANGKTVATEVLMHLLGLDNVTHVPLEQFGDRFAMAPTIGKLANIVSEIGWPKHISEDILKAVVSGDRLKAEQKYQPPTQAVPTARLIFATNELPRFSDRSRGLWRRMLILPFNVHIPEERQDRALARKICKRELPGIFNWALRGLRRLRKNNCFTMPESTRQAIDEHQRASNPTRTFLEEECESHSDSEVKTTSVYVKYTTWCHERGIAHTLPEQQFGKEVHRIYPSVERKQKRTGKVRRYYYVGLRLMKPLRPVKRGGRLR